jgi:hypothetical protein
LREEFNWPPRHAAKGKKRQIREQLGSTPLMKTVLIEQLRTSSFHYDAELLSNLVYVLKYAIKEYPIYTNEVPKMCAHNRTE